MEKDFHYYCIAVLARAAGFSAPDALTVGYASQYVDDATESETIRVGTLLFDPVRTAYAGLKSYDWSVQKRVYLPFHFLPPAPMTTTDASFVTTTDSSLAQALLAEARRSAPGLRRLCAIGVALHTYADTWAHEGFSGRDHPENDVQGLQVRKAGAWQGLAVEDFLLDLLPAIGHAQAGHLPDRPFLEWRCARPATGRHNAPAFLAAAKASYTGLARLAPAKAADRTPWADLAPTLEALFAVEDDSTDGRCTEWQARFTSLFPAGAYAYDADAWRADALGARPPKVPVWEPGQLAPVEPPRYPLKPGFLDSPWVQFHRAALRQRHFVLESLL